MQDKAKVSIVAICGIVAIEVVALAVGINGKILSVAVGLIAGIAGYKIKERLEGTV